MAALLHVLGTLSGVVLLVVGAATFVLPIPIGAALMALGLLVLTGTSRTFANWVRGLRASQSRVDGAVRKAERKLPSRIGGLMRRTDPDADDDRGASG